MTTQEWILLHQTLKRNYEGFKEDYNISLHGKTPKMKRSGAKNAGFALSRASYWIDEKKVLGF